MLILLTFQHFYMTKSEAFASDFVDSLKCSLLDCILYLPAHFMSVFMSLTKLASVFKRIISGC